jgi:signal transduction histidine kinase/ActR/RegA family two-component response regulator
MKNQKVSVKSILFVVLVALGIAGTRWTVGLFFGVDFIFGSIATFLILSIYGAQAAIYASILIGAYTMVHWGHPFAFLALVAEMVFISQIFKRARYNLTLATGFYWILVGIPLVFGCYLLFLDLPWDRSLLAATKQAINEIFNAVIASLILEHSPLSRISALRIKKVRSVFQTVFNIFVAAAIIPSFAILVLDSRKVVEQVENSIQLRLETIGASLTLFSERWKDQHVAMVELVARLTQQMRAPTPRKMQELIQQFRAASPDLSTLYISDPRGKAIAFDPVVNAEGKSTIGLDFSDRDYFNVLKNRTRLTEITPAFLARGGITVPVIAVNTAIISHGKFQGIVSSALDLTHLTNILNTTGNDTNYFATIVDAEGHVVSSNNPTIKPLDDFPGLTQDPNVTLRSNNFYQRWPSEKASSPMVRWSKSYLGLMLPLQPDAKWKLYVEIPLADQQTLVYHQYGRAIAMLLILVLFILAASHWLATMIGDPLSKLSSQTTNLPDRLSSKKKSLKNIFWPQSEFQEVKTLVDNFKGMDLELNKRFQELEMANRMKDEFLATLSHELRTPLNVILGHAQVLKEQIAGNAEDRTDQITSSVEAISRNASIQNQLVSDLLDISAIITGKIAFQPKIVSLTELAKTAVEGLRLSAEAKGIKLTTQFTSEPCTVLGDSTRLHQVIWNLLSNAIKFTPRDGTVELRVYLENEGKERFSVIEVKDSGRGIEPDFLPYMFERFRQEDSTTTRKFGGLGLGLSIVRHISELHGGTAQASSPGKGKGATFKIVLPFSDQADPTATEKLIPAELNVSSPAKEAPFNAHQQKLNGLSVLVIDDDTDSRELLEYVLTNSGAQTTPAGNAKDALELAKNEIFDLIISDIGLPDEDGYSLIRRLRKDTASKSNQVPAIALTAYAREEDRVKCLEAGFQSYLAKPVDLQKLILAIHELTDSES